LNEREKNIDDDDDDDDDENFCCVEGLNEREIKT